MEVASPRLSEERIQKFIHEAKTAGVFLAMLGLFSVFWWWLV